jgi:tetratricopeptide (TPR) repeat protein
MKSLTIWHPFYAVLYLSLLSVPTWGSQGLFEPEKSLIRYRFLKEQSPQDKESLYDELMALRAWISSEIKILNMREAPLSSQVPLRLPSQKTIKTKAPVAKRSQLRNSPDKSEVKGAYKAYKSKKFDIAVALYTALIRRHPDVQNFYLYRGRSFKKLEFYDKAIRDFEMMDLQESPATVGMELIRLYDRMKLYSKAIDLGEKLMVWYPDYSRTNLTLGIIYKKRKDFENARKVLKKYLKVKPNDPLALHELGNLHEKMREWSLALVTYNRLLKYHPNHKLGLRDRGNVHYHLKNYADAHSDLEHSDQLHIPWVKKLFRVSLSRARELGQKKPSVSRKISKRVSPVVRDKKPEASVQDAVPVAKVVDLVVKKQSRLTPKIATSRVAQQKPLKKWTTPGLKLFQAGNTAKALSKLKEEIRIYPRSLELSEAYFQCLQKLSRYDEIIQEYDRMQSFLPGHIDFSLEQNYYRLALGHWDHVLDALNKNQSSSFAQHLRSMAFQGKGQLEDAEEALFEAKSLDSRFDSRDAGRFLWLMRVKHFEMAYPLGKRLLEKPRDWLYYDMAQVAWSQGNGVEAVLYLTKTVQVQPDNSDAFFLLAQIMHSLKRFEDRDIFIQKAEVLNPGDRAIFRWKSSVNLN